jgi:hypothetical protein
MKKVIYFLLLFIPFSLLANEGNEKLNYSIVKGKITDYQTQEFLAGVEIKIEGTDIVTYSDFDGNFEISQLKPGKYTFSISTVSYKVKQVYSVEIKKASNYNVNLSLTQN